MLDEYQTISNGDKLNTVILKYGLLKNEQLLNRSQFWR